MIENHLTIKHQDGELHYQLKAGGYTIERDRITISVDTQAAGQKQYPSCALFCLVNCPLPSGKPAVGDVYRYEDDHAEGFSDDADELIHANAYFDFHVEHVNLSWKVLAIHGCEIVFEMSAITDDDRRANPITARFRLSPAPKMDLWLPV